MSIVNVLRRCRPAAAVPVTASLAATGLVAASLAAAGLAVAPAAQAAGTAHAQAAAGGLHVTGKVDLGPGNNTFSIVASEAPNGTVYYAQGSIVYRVKGGDAPVNWLQASGTVLAVAANRSDLIVEVGSKVSAYALSSGHRLRTWKLPSIAKITSASLYAVGRTVWANTDWATDESGFEFANVDRMNLSSAAVHRVAKNNAFPADMAANTNGAYYEGMKGSKDYVFRALHSGALRRHKDVNIDAPLALSSGNVYLLAIHERQGGHTYLDAFHGRSLSARFSRRVASNDSDIAGTGIGLLLLGGGKVRLLNASTGSATSTLAVPGAATLVPGRSAVVLAVQSSTIYLIRLGK
jgi:hypothetical protein